MGSLSLYETLLTSLTSLKDRVDEYASRCLPDHKCAKGADFSFEKIDTSTIIPDPLHGESVGMMIEGISIPFLFTNWSRSQLLSHVGTKEKWFRSVSLERQVDELNLRRGEFYRHQLRLVKAADEEPVGLMRGLVSDSFTDIPDTEVMAALLQSAGAGGHALRGHSAKTDRAFYAHVVMDMEIGLPGHLIHGFPGVVVKNSEVGYTALHVIPVLFLPSIQRHVVFSKQATLRRVHRGSVKELSDQFNDALEKAAVVWASVEQRGSILVKTVYTSEDDAVVMLKTAITSAGGTKRQAMTAENHYRAAKHTLHTALSVFDSVLSLVSSSNVDDQHLEAALAGAALWVLT